MGDWAPLWLSLRVASTATILAGATGIAVAYLLAKARFRGRALVEALVTVPIVLPPTVLGYYLLTTLGVTSPIGRAVEQALGRPIVFTPLAAVIAASVSAFPFVVRTARAAIEDVDPALESVARVAGHPERRVALHVTLPVARRGLAAAVGLGFARALGDFGATLMVAGNIPGRTRTLPIAVYDSVQLGDGVAARSGALVLAAIAALVLLAVTQLAATDARRGRS